MFFQPSHVNSGNSPNSPPKSPLMAQTLRRSVSILSTLRHVAPLCNRPVQRQHYFSPFSLSDNKLCLRNVCAPHSSASFATAVCEPRHVSGFRFAKKKTVVFNRGQDFIQRQLWIQQAPFSSAHRGHAGSNMDAINELNDVRDKRLGMKYLHGHRFNTTVLVLLFLPESKTMGYSVLYRFLNTSSVGWGHLTKPGRCWLLIRIMFLPLCYCQSMFAPVWQQMPFGPSINKKMACQRPIYSFHPSPPLSPAPHIPIPPSSNPPAPADLFQELDFVFGSTLPPTSLSEPPTSLRETQHSHSVPESGSDSPSPTEQPPMPLFTPPSFAPTTESTHKLTHVDRKGKASMVDVSDKANTNRVAVATGRVLLGPKAFEMVKANEIAKGDVLTVAQIAGIQGAKSTSTLIPLCHNILLSQVDVALHLREQSHSVEIEARARTVGTTGVEMEALTAVTVAALTVYDMCKAVSKEIEIQNICLKHKSGGKSGDWHRVESGISRNKLDPKEGELSQLNDGFGDLREDSSWEPQFGHAR